MKMRSARKRKENESKRRSIQIMQTFIKKGAKGLNGCFHFLCLKHCAALIPLKKHRKIKHVIIIVFLSMCAACAAAYVSKSNFFSFVCRRNFCTATKKKEKRIAVSLCRWPFEPRQIVVTVHNNQTG